MAIRAYLERQTFDGETPSPDIFWQSKLHLKIGKRCKTSVARGPWRWRSSEESSQVLLKGLEGPRKNGPLPTMQQRRLSQPETNADDPIGASLNRS
jgi:hypothetical protein